MVSASFTAPRPPSFLAPTNIDDEQTRLVGIVHGCSECGGSGGRCGEDLCEVDLLASAADPGDVADAGSGERRRGAGGGGPPSSREAPPPPGWSSSAPRSKGKENFLGGGRAGG